MHYIAGELKEATEHWWEKEVRPCAPPPLQHLRSCLARFSQNAVYIIHTELANNGRINEWGMEEERWKRNRHSCMGEPVEEQVRSGSRTERGMRFFIRTHLCEQVEKGGTRRLKMQPLQKSVHTSAVHRRLSPSLVRNSSLNSNFALLSAVNSFPGNDLESCKWMKQILHGYMILYIFCYLPTSPVSWRTISHWIIPYFIMQEVACPLVRILRLGRWWECSASIFNAGAIACVLPHSCNLQFLAVFLNSNTIFSSI